MEVKKLTRLEIEKYIRQNASGLTMMDMADDFGVPHSSLREICARIGVHPITIPEQVRKFIEENRTKMTFARVVSALDMTESYVKNVCSEMGISPYIDFKKPPESESKKPVQQKDNRLSPGKILSGYQLSSSAHYNHDKENPEWFEKIKNAQ